MVARSEDALHALGFREVRVRFHGDVARIEVGRDELPRLLEPAIATQATEAVRAAGFRFVTVDPEGFRSGSLNVGVARG